MAGPSFFVVGAPKAALHHALRQHDDVFLSDVKESHLSAYVANRAEPISGFAEAVPQEGPRREARFPFTYRYLEWGRYMPIPRIRALQRALDADLRAERTAHFAEEIDRLEELMGRDLTRWR